VNSISRGRDESPIAILHEDDDVLALDKPAGLLAVPDRFDKTRPNIMLLLEAARPGQWLANVHRLDFNTSGVFVVVKRQEAFRELARQFRDRETKKQYVAVAQRIPPESPMTIDLPIGPHPKVRGLARIDHGRGQEARTVVEIQEKFRGYSLLKVNIITGRMHQVRVHLQAIGCPLIGDVDYGGGPLLLSQIKKKYKPKEDEPERPLLDRPALHAEQLTFAQPSTGAPITIVAPWPKDLTLAVKYLRKFVPA
jgi:23S rRNA pseudouridine1911/1915/1917 synthase